jgi:hypothetical protein
MKAVVYEHYGTVEELEIRELRRPEPAAGHDAHALQLFQILSAASGSEQSVNSIYSSCAAARQSSLRKEQTVADKLTNTQKKKVEKFMAGVYECDDINPDVLEEILNDAGEPAAKYFEQHYLLDSAIFARVERAVRLLLEAGVDPNFGEFDPPLKTARSRKGEVSERILAMMLEYGATDA